MANWATLKSSIADAIKANSNQEITGVLLQNTIINIISILGENATFAGTATLATNPGIYDGPVFYLASEAGIYSNFGNIEALHGELTCMIWSDSQWKKKSCKVVEIVNDLVSGGLNKALSAEMGKSLHDKLLYLQTLITKKQNILECYREDLSNGTVEIFSQDSVSISNDSQGGTARVEVHNEEIENEIIPVATMSAEKENGDSAHVEVRGNEVFIDGDSIRINGADIMEAIVNDLGLTTDADVNTRMRIDAHPSADRKTRVYKWKYSDGGSGFGISVARKTGWGYFQYRMNRATVEFRDVDSNGSAGNWQSWGGTHVVYDEATHKIGLALHDGFNLGTMLNFSTAISLPVATTTKDGLMTKEQVAALEKKQERLGVGDGISLKDNIASVIIGLGLAFSGREIVVNYDPSSLTFTSNNKLSVNIGKGLYINPDNQLGVNVGDGLEINHSDKTVQLAQTVRDEIAELNRRIQALEAQI